MRISERPFSLSPAPGPFIQASGIHFPLILRDRLKRLIADKFLTVSVRPGQKVTVADRPEMTPVDSYQFRAQLVRPERKEIFEFELQPVTRSGRRKKNAPVLLEQLAVVLNVESFLKAAAPNPLLSVRIMEQRGTFRFLLTVLKI
jgi:hypothetical protein